MLDLKSFVFFQYSFSSFTSCLQSSSLLAYVTIGYLFRMDVSNHYLASMWLQTYDSWLRKYAREGSSKKTLPGIRVR